VIKGNPSLLNNPERLEEMQRNLKLASVLEQVVEVDTIEKEFTRKEKEAKGLRGEDAKAAKALLEKEEEETLTARSATTYLSLTKPLVDDEWHKLTVPKLKELLMFCGGGEASGAKVAIILALDPLLRNKVEDEPETVVDPIAEEPVVEPAVEEPVQEPVAVQADSGQPVFDGQFLQHRDDVRANPDDGEGARKENVTTMSGRTSKRKGMD